MSTSKLVRLDPPALRRLSVHHHAAIFRPLAGDERDMLRSSLRAGFDPQRAIVVDAASGAICDGRNRRDVCVELGIAAFVVEREFADDAEIAAYVVSANLARRHLDQRERRELAGRLVMNGTSTREAAKATGTSKATAQRAAAAARKAGVSSETPARSRRARTHGADGKSYPATKKRPSTKAATVQRFDTVARQYQAMRQAQIGLRTALVGCVVSGRYDRRHHFRFTVVEVGFDDDSGDAWVHSESGDDGACVGCITAIEKLPSRSQKRSRRDASTTVDSIIAVACGVSARPSAPIERVALRWPDEVCASLGVSRSWLYDSGLASEMRFLRHNKVRLVAVSELERVIEKLSARWDE